MRKSAILLPLIISILLLPVITFANNQGLESIDCSTKQLKDTFSPTENVCIKQTRIVPGEDCGDPNDVIQVYALSYRTPYNTPDGSFYYTDGRTLVPYTKKIAVTINPDRSIYWNLGTFSAGSYDIAQGGNDYRGNDIYQGGCFDELGSPLVSAGFDVAAPSTTTTTSSTGQACTSDASCGSGYFCANIQPPYNIGTCQSSTPTTQPGCQEDWNCGPWTACVNGRQDRGCTDLNGCGTTVNRPEIDRTCGTTTTMPPTSTTLIYQPIPGIIIPEIFLNVNVQYIALALILAGLLYYSTKGKN